MITVRTADPDAVTKMMKDAGFFNPSAEHLHSGFIVEGMSFRKLCGSIEEVEGVTFTDRMGDANNKSEGVRRPADGSPKPSLFGRE